MTFDLDRAAFKPTDIATRLGVDRSTVYRWIESRELPSFELAGHRYVLASALELFAERRDKGVSLEQQAAKRIGPGEEVEGEVDLLVGLTLPVATEAPAAAGSSIEAAFELLRSTLDEYEARFHVASEHVHRLRLVERRTAVEGVPDDVADQWARAYAAYMNLAVVPAGRQ